MHMNPRFKKFYEKYYQGLVGKKVLAAGVTPDGFPYMELDSGERIEVSQDEEGNGPGFLFGLPKPSL
jgi:hypothetical protein